MGWVAIGYDHGYDAEVFCFGLALDPAYVEGFVGVAWRGSARTTQRIKPCSGNSGKDEGERETVHQVLQAEC